MGDFTLAHEKYLDTQGMNLHFDENVSDGDFLLCSDCFHDEGLRLTAVSIAIADTSKCVCCGLISGGKLTKDLIRRLGYLFFVRGTIERFEWGGFPLVQMNDRRSSDIEVPSWLENDIKLIEKAAELGFFYYSPRFWMLGEITPLKDLFNSGEIENVINRIENEFPTMMLTEEHFLYRVRVNPEFPDRAEQFDSPPDGLGNDSRFGTCKTPLLYASPDIELCIHECRATVEDKLYSAKLIPNAPLKLLNLATLLPEEGVTEFDSLDLAIHFLFLAGKHSYVICGQIAKHFREKGYDGIIYPSYFSYLRTGLVPFETIDGMSIRRIPDLSEYATAQSMPNIVFFGRPIADGKLNVSSINRIMLKSISYEMTFGPASIKSEVTTMSTPEYLELRTERYKQNILNSLYKSDFTQSGSSSAT